MRVKPEPTSQSIEQMPTQIERESRTLEATEMRIEPAPSVGDLAKLVAQDAKTLRAQVQRDPVVRKRVAELRDTCAAAVAVSDDELAQAVLSAADVVTAESTEPTTGGLSRVIERRRQSAAIGATVVETPRYLNPPDSPAWGAQGGADRRVTRNG